MTNVSQSADIANSLRLLLEPGQVAELRIPKTFRGTVSGYFNDIDKITAAAARQSGKAPGVYFTLNPANNALLARADNRLKEYAQNTTSDGEVTRRCWLPLDFDPKRPADISSTNEEHKTALARAGECYEWLLNLGFQKDSLLLADSGNGGHVLVRIDLQNDTSSTTLVQRCIEAVALRFSDDAVTVDLSVFNAARIWKVYGTLAAKGDDTQDRPHRFARVLEAPRSATPALQSTLEALATMAPQDSGPAAAQQQRSRFDIDAWITTHNLDVIGPHPWQSGRKWIFRVCPWDAAHTNRAAYLIQHASGALGAGCHHHGCTGKSWHELRDAVEPGWRSGGVTPDEQQERKSQATILVELAGGAELFHTPDSEAWATIEVGGHKEHWLLNSRSLRLWLRQMFYEATSKAPAAQALQDAIGVLEGQALFDGPTHHVFARVAGHNGKIYIDLGDENRQAAEIDPTGWRIVSEAPVKFYRPPGMLPLPQPEAGGRIADLSEFVNVQKDDFVLVEGFLVGCLHLSGPYPILLPLGEQGTAKTTLCRMIQALVDPQKAGLRQRVREDRDLVIAASNAYLVALDNLSGMPEWLADSLCSLATGIGFRTRQLYTNTEETLLEARRPIVVNGIEDPAPQRGDFQERAIRLLLPQIPEDKRKSEAELWQAFEEARPRLLGALYSAVSTALSNQDHVRKTLKTLPRMADFALWAVAAEPAFGCPPGTFLARYTGNQSESHFIILEADFVGKTLLEWLDLQQVEFKWSGTANELLILLNSLVPEDKRPEKGWPRDATRMGGRLRRLAPALRGVGLDVSDDREAKTGQRTWLIRKVRKISVTSVTLPSEEPQREEKISNNDNDLDENRGFVGGDAEKPRGDAEKPRGDAEGDAKNADSARGDAGDAAFPGFSNEVLDQATKSLACEIRSRRTMRVYDAHSFLAYRGLTKKEVEVVIEWQTDPANPHRLWRLSSTGDGEIMIAAADCKDFEAGSAEVEERAGIASEEGDSSFDPATLGKDEEAL